MNYSICRVFLLSVFLILSCNSLTVDQSLNMDSNENVLIDYTNPIVVADQVILAMGGEESWNNLNYISWTFFGSRHLVWDKKNGRVRIESPMDSSIYLIDLKTKEGRFKKGNMETTDSKILGDRMNRAEGIWINDMYWLFMPFKLNDEGVNLKYLREDSVEGNLTSVLEMTFAGVGITPENKYEIFVDQSDHLVKQWTFYESSDDSVAYATWPWDNYQQYGNLLLSAERSDNKGPSNVRVYDTLDDEIFTTFTPFAFY